MRKINLEKYKNSLEILDLIKYTGHVSQVIGLTIESIGPAVKVGEVCNIYTVKDSTPIVAEVVGFNGKKVLLMPLGEMEGIGPNSKVEALGTTLNVKVGNSLLGRILDGLGNPIDGKGPLDEINTYPVMGKPLNPLERNQNISTSILGNKGLGWTINLWKWSKDRNFCWKWCW